MLDDEGSFLLSLVPASDVSPVPVYGVTRTQVPMYPSQVILSRINADQGGIRRFHK